MSIWCIILFCDNAMTDEITIALIVPITGNCHDSQLGGKQLTTIFKIQYFKLKSIR